MAAVLQTLRSGATEIPEEQVNAIDTAIIRTSGVLSTSDNHFLVEESGTPAMTVDVRQGYAFIVNSTNTMTYPVRLHTADATVNITANSSGNSRIDAIVLYIDLGATANATATNVATLVAVAGTPAGSPTAPDATAIATAIGAANPYLRLANVTVESGETTILDGDVSDQRVNARFVFNSPKILTSLLDTNGNEVLNFTATSSAVNEPTVTNAAANGQPTIGASGSDTNIWMGYLGKGTGVGYHDVKFWETAIDSTERSNTGDWADITNASIATVTVPFASVLRCSFFGRIRGTGGGNPVIRFLVNGVATGIISGGLQQDTNYPANASVLVNCDAGTNMTVKAQMRNDVTPTGTAYVDEYFIQVEVVGAQ